MKTIKSYVLVLMVLLSVAACDENESTSTSSTMSNEEAADMVATSLAEEASGMTTVVTDAATTAEEASEAADGGRTASCGYSESVNLSKTNREGSVITYSYDYNYDYQMTCNSENEPLTLVSGADFTGSFDAPRLASSHTGTSDLNVSALDEAATSYLVDGSYSRSGSFESKVRNKNTSTSTVLISIDEVTVDKEDKEIVDGSATVSITGEVPGKGSFSFNGSIVFEGNGKATLTIDGTTYSVDLESGKVD